MSWLDDMVSEREARNESAVAARFKTAEPAPLVTVVSASGGVGKSAIALVAAYLLARAGKRIALVEGDLQFGDYGFWFGLDKQDSSLADGVAARPVALTEMLDLYKAPSLPECAELVADDVAKLVDQLRWRYELVVADTGALWSGLTAELVLSASLYWLVFDQRPASVAGALRAAELCRRIGAADTRCVYVSNKSSSHARMTLEDLEQTLNSTHIQRVPDGKTVADELIGVGDVEELVSLDNAFVRGVDELLAACMPRLGVLYGRAASQKKAGWFK